MKKIAFILFLAGLTCLWFAPSYEKGSVNPLLAGGALFLLIGIDLWYKKRKRKIYTY